MPASEAACQRDARRQGAKRNFRTPSDITYGAISASLIVEVDFAETAPDLDRKATEDNTHISLVYVVDSICSGPCYREPDLRRHIAKAYAISWFQFSSSF